MGQTTFTGPVISNNGFIDASFTTAERDAIVDPQPGLLIYNTDTNTYQVCTVGGGVPTWDTAFGGGGGGGGGFPYLLTNLTSYVAPGSMIGNTASKLLFNQTGTQAVTVQSSGINVTSLTTPYDLSSASSTSYYPTFLDTNYPLGAYLSGDGSVLYLVKATSSASVRVISFNLSIANDLTTINGGSEAFVSEFYIGSMMNSDQARGFELSSDGTKFMFSVVSGMGGQSYLRTITLTTPYNPASINGSSYTGSADITSYVQALHYMGSSTAWGLAVNSTGTVVYVTVNGYVGMSYPATYILEFKLGTAYDVSSIQSSYAAATAAGTDLSDYNCGITLANSNIYIGNDAMMFGGPNYNVNSLTVISAPNITGVSPTSGATGTSVTITGTGFTGTSSVTFGGTNAGSFTVNSATQITATSPSGLPTGTPVDIVVTNGAGSSTEVAAFTATAAPAATLGTSGYLPTYTITSPVNITSFNKDGTLTLYFNVSSSATETWLQSLPIGTVFTVVIGSGISSGDSFTSTTTVTGGAGTFACETNYSGPGWSFGATVSLFSVV